MSIKRNILMSAVVSLINSSMLSFTIWHTVLGSVLSTARMFVN